MTQQQRNGHGKAESLAAIGTQGAVDQRIDLRSPKERAVIDVLALTMAADGELAASEISLVVEQLEKMLGLQPGGPGLADQVRAHVAGVERELEQSSRNAILDRSVRSLETAQERQMTFALAMAVACADGVMDPKEADFLVELRTALKMTEAQAITAAAGVAGTLACLGRKRA